MRLYDVTVSRRLKQTAHVSIRANSSEEAENVALRAMTGNEELSWSQPKPILGSEDIDDRTVELGE